MIERYEKKEYKKIVQRKKKLNKDQLNSIYHQATFNVQVSFSKKENWKITPWLITGVNNIRLNYYNRLGLAIDTLYWMKDYKMSKRFK